MIVTDTTRAQPLPLHAGAIVRQEVTFTPADLDAFAQVSGDRASVHFDDAYARERGFPERIVHGLLLGARFSRLMGMFLPGEDSIIQSLNLQYRRPVPVGSRLMVSVEVERVVEAVGAVLLKLTGTTDDIVAVEGRAQCVMCKHETTGPATT